METLLMLVLVQGCMGAFDVLYHHELTERLPRRPTAATELKLHGVRNFFYVIVFLSLGFVEWRGVFTWIFAAILITEVLITLWDFVEEDVTRKLPASERITHTLLAVNYGVILGFFWPFLVEWEKKATGFAIVEYGWYSVSMALCSAGVLIWGLRDYMAGLASERRNARTHVEWPVAHTKLRVLVTGGTGFIGIPLSQALIQQGHQITLLTRNPAVPAEKLKGSYRLINSLDALDADDAFDAIINLAGEPISKRWTKSKKAGLLRNRAEITEKLAEFCSKAKHKPHTVINGSAIGIYGTSEDRVFAEHSEPSDEKIGLFPRAICEEWENAAKQFEKMGIRLCILRIGLVLEQDGGPLAQMLFPFEMGVGGKMGNGRQQFSWIHREDVIGIILHCLNTADVSGVFNAVAPEPVSNAEFSRILGSILKRPALLPLPAFVVKLGFGEMGEALLLSGQKVMPEHTQAVGYSFRHPSLSGTLKAIL